MGGCILVIGYDSDTYSSEAADSAAAIVRRRGAGWLGGAYAEEREVRNSTRPAGWLSDAAAACDPRTVVSQAGYLLRHAKE
jgi:hypothetical protein